MNNTLEWILCNQIYHPQDTGKVDEIIIEFPQGSQIVSLFY